ncbi:hypothetical protein [Nonomuraea sp. bgisy101]|uniref:hypothetical protein n=1 Tax=Nonomuraea sp. bgisy101 TaxID=3413784 RepID=UPI003D762BBD
MDWIERIAGRPEAGWLPATETAGRPHPEPGWLPATETAGRPLLELAPARAEDPALAARVASGSQGFRLPVRGTR